MRSKPLPPEPATSLTFDAVTTWPFGAVRVTLAGVSDENSIARSNITRTLESVVAVGPFETSDTTRGGVVVPSGWAAPTAVAALTTPPVATLPVRAVDFAAVFST